MEQHSLLDDNTFEAQFAACKLSPAVFTHEAHIRLAWIHVKKYGVEQAIQNICNQLLAFVDAVGARDKYNKTLTIAAIKAVKHFIDKEPVDNFSDFITRFPRLKYNFKELLAFHYKVDIYNSPQAKQEFLEPDLLPFT